MASRPAPGLALLTLFFLSADAIYIMTRCQCPQLRTQIRLCIQDFDIKETGPHCSNTEIIVTVKAKEKTLEVCLDPSEQQGTELLACWNRIEMDPSRKEECIKQIQKKNRKNRSC
ncbi:C-X-C motif chemokine 3 [Latimeria chalumnae]|uniref:C-X-C motif chemokine 3 n=1 Tax=Latimeria chalumnae TaxID=7897 RepID=UPI0003C132CD|nr:PREDICTED: C-X-C motif chemokine 3-like [Latimeria chalumnae]|eukprot:XP_006009315.1 PREDICTED: C-X-C motif chemokine 3-like [Latimeria chalumnae]